MAATESRARPLSAAGPDAHAQRLLLLASSGRLGAIVGCLAELRVADEIADQPRPIAQIAGRVGAEPAALERLLRCACAVGLLEYVPGEDAVGLTELSRGLVSDSPDSILPLVRYSTSEIVAAPYRHLAEAVRSGRPAFAAAFGEPIWEHLSHDVEHGQFFDATMSQMSGRMIGAYVRQIADPAIATIADIGGGTGSFLRAYLAASPAARGILVERPEVLAGVTAPAQRIELLAADIFADPLPAGCDAYVLMTVLHNWPEDLVRGLLDSVRRAAGPRSRLFVCEHVLAEGGGWDFGRLLDLDMMLLFGGQERTARQWQRLLADCGFEIDGGLPGAGWAVLTCRPAATAAATGRASSGQARR